MIKKKKKKSGSDGCPALKTIRRLKGFLEMTEAKVLRFPSTGALIHDVNCIRMHIQGCEFLLKNIEEIADSCIHVYKKEEKDESN